MWAGIIAIIGFVTPILGLVIKWWLDKKLKEEATEKRKVEDERLDRETVKETVKETISNNESIDAQQKAQDDWFNQK